MAKKGDPNQKRDKLFKHLKENKMTPLGYDEFSEKYASGEKFDELYSYLDKEGMTPLSKDEFSKEYFGDVKKKEATPSAPLVTTGESNGEKYITPDTPDYLRDTAKKEELAGPSPQLESEAQKLTWENEIKPQFKWGPKEFKQGAETTGDSQDIISPALLPEINPFIPSSVLKGMGSYGDVADKSDTYYGNITGKTAKTVSEIGKAYNRGMANGLKANNIQTENPENIDFQRLAELSEVSNENQPQGVYRDFMETEDLAGFFAETAKSPDKLVELISVLSAESFTQQITAAPSAKGSAIAAGAGAGSAVPALGTATGAFAGYTGSISYALEESAFITEKMQELGYDTTKKEDVEEFFTNEKLLAETKAEAQNKGLVIGALDALSVGVAGKLGGSTTLKRLAREVPAQMGMGAAGEAGGQVAQEGEVSDVKGVIAEALGEVGGSAPEIFVGMTQNNPDLISTPSGKNTKELAKIKKDQESLANDIENAPDWLKPELKKQSQELIKKKNKLVVDQAEFYNKFSEEDKNRVSKINKELASLNEYKESDVSEETKQQYTDKQNELVKEKIEIESKYLEDAEETGQVREESAQEEQKERLGDMPEQREEQQKEVTDGKEKDTEEQQSMLEGVQTRGDETQERQEGSELRTEEQEEGQVEYFERDLGDGEKVIFKVEEGKRTPIEETQVPEGATIKSEEEIGETEVTPVSRQGVQEENDSKPVSLKYEKKDVPKSFKETTGGERAFGEAANIYNKSLDRRQGEEKAYQNAEEYIKQSSAFDRAGDVVSEQMIRDFKNLVGEKTKRSPSANKIIGKTPPPKKGFTNKQIISFAEQESKRGANAGRKEIRNIVDNFAKEIKKRIGDIPSGELTATQTKQLSKAATGVRTPSQMRRFSKIAKKIVEDVDYSNKLNEAQNLKSKLDTKNLPSNIVSFFKKFKEINPENVSDIDEYIETAKGLNQYRLSPKINDKEGEIQIDETSPLSLKAAEEYIQKEKENNLNIAAQEAIESLKEEGFSEEELKDMKPQDIVNLLDAIQDTDANSFVELKDGDKKREALKRVVIFNQGDLGGISDKGLDASEKVLKEALSSVNVDNLNPNKLRDLYISLVNAIFNNAYNGTDWVRAEYVTQQNKKPLYALRKVYDGVIDQITLSVSPIQQAMKALSRTSENAAEVQRLIGLTKIFNGRAQTEKKAVAFKDELKEIMKGSLESLEEDVFLSMYGILYTSGDNNFGYYKRAIKKMIDNDLKSNDDKSKDNAVIAQKVFRNRMENAENIKEIKLSAREKKVIDFMTSKFAGIKDDFKKISEQVYNIEFKEDNNKYLPLIFRKRSQQEIEEITASNFYANKEYLAKTKDGSLKARTYSVDPNTTTFDYNFLNTMAKKYESQVKDIETARGINDYNAFHNSLHSEYILNGSKSKNALYERMKKYVGYGRKKSELSSSEQMVINVLNKAAELGARVKLGKAKQVVVQSVPVFMRSMALLGKNNLDIVKLIVDKSSNKDFREVSDNLLSNYPIARRGVLKQEFENVNNEIPKSTKKNWRGQVERGVSDFDDIAKQLQMLPIEKGDVYTARTTWLAFYVKSLRKQGIYTGSQNLKDILKTPNDVAASFAEQMVAETQVPSDVGQNGLFLSPETTGNIGVELAHFARRAMFPFITFRANQAISTLQSIKNITDLKSRKEIGAKEFNRRKADAVKELSGVFAENFVFSGLNTMYYLATLTTASYIASLFGIDFDNDNEEDKKNKVTSWLEKTIVSAFSEMNPLFGFGALDKLQIEAINSFYFRYVLTDEEKKKYINNSELKKSKNDKDIELVMDKAVKNLMKTNDAVIRDYNKTFGEEPWYEPYGQLGFAFEVADQVNQTVEMSREDEYKYITPWNTTATVEMSDAEKNLAILSAIMQASNYISPGETADIGRRLKSGIMYKKDKKKKKSEGRGGVR